MNHCLSFLLLSILVISSNCSFQSVLFSQMNDKNNGKNLIISPLSIFQVLSLTANGARGETLTQMLHFLQHTNLDDLNTVNYQIVKLFRQFSTLETANAVMARFTPLPSFVNVARKYLAPVQPLKSVEQVNKWVSHKTHGKIDKILNDLTDDILMILINAVYFNGEWVKKFDRELTHKLPFYNLGKQEKSVDTMTQTEYFQYYEDKNAQAISLRFRRDSMSAIVILPAEGNDINRYINTLSQSDEEYNKIIKGLKEVKVNLKLPKFELTFDKELSEILKKLGMTNAFNPKDADFSGLHADLKLVINQVIHKTYLKVNEEGTEAAAATLVATEGASGINEKIYKMHVNRPFLFLLRNSQLPAGYDLIFMSKIEKIE